MMGARRGFTILLLAFALAGCNKQKGAAKAPQAVRARFDFHIGFWVNLHQRLFAESSAVGVPEPLQARTPEEQAQWNKAVAFYRRHFVVRTGMALLAEDDLVALNRRLAALEQAPDLSAATDLPIDVTGALEKAASVYRTSGWIADADFDRRWVDALVVRLEQDGDGEALATDLEHVYRSPWPAEPIRVDVSAYAGPVGGYTVLGPPQITISSRDPRNRGDMALEMVCHEASHVLVRPLRDAIDRAHTVRHLEPPPTLWHAALFYTTGEIVRRHHNQSYQTYAERNGLYSHDNGWDLYHAALDTAWKPYLDNQASWDTAVNSIVTTLARESR